MKKQFTIVFVASACALVLASIAVVTPKAVRAAVATLVLVTNTPGNPAITQDVTKQAAQQVDIICVADDGLPPNPSSCSSVWSLNAVPATQSLVITSVDIQSYVRSTGDPCSGSVRISLDDHTLETRKRWSLLSGNTTSFTYPSGFVLGPGFNPEIVVGGPTECTTNLEMHGYLTTN